MNDNLIFFSKNCFDSSGQLCSLSGSSLFMLRAEEGVKKVELGKDTNLLGLLCADLRLYKYIYCISGRIFVKIALLKCVALFP